MVTAKKVKWTEAARNDLFNIFKRLEGNSRERALEVVNQLLNVTKSLNSEYPKGTPEPLLKNEKEPYKYLIKGFYKIIYSIVEDDVFVEIIYHTRQDPNVG